MRALVTGGGGMLARELVAVFGMDATALPRAELDITDPAAVRAAVRGHDVVLNAAAYTRVDDAESHEQDAYAVNALGAANLAAAAEAEGARLVQFSTDYVFDGTATTPYAEDHPLSPLGAYGRTKAEGERLARAAHPDGTLIVRIAWLYGAGGANFAKTMRTLAQQRETVSVVTDQRGQPTWGADVARSVAALLAADAPAGVYHATNGGEATWFDFARAVFEESGLDPDRVLPTDGSAFRRPAPRPAYSVLGRAALPAAGVPEPRPWREALRAAVRSGLFD